MAAFQVEQASCNGRGFAPANPNGFLQRFKEWVVKTPVNGGPGWYLVDDQSGVASPYIVVCDQNNPAPNTPAKWIRLSQPATSGVIEVRIYLYWNSTTHIGRGLYGAWQLPTGDDTDFIYDFRGGPECMFIQSFQNNVWDPVIIDEFTADPNLVDVTVNAVVTGSHMVNANFQLRGWQLNNIANAVDANGWMYVTVVFVSGTTWRADVFRATARGGADLVANGTFTGQVGTGTYTVSVSQQNSSTVSGTLYFQAPTTADATIAVRVTQVTVAPGEGAQFTAGNDYFIYDLQNACCVQYVRVTAVNVDTLTLGQYLYRPYSAGARIGAYPHRFFVAGSNNVYLGRNSNLPYYSVYGNMASFENPSNPVEQTNNREDLWQSNEWPPAAQLSTDDNYISTMSPNDKGEWAVQRPGVCEYSSYGQNNNSQRNGNRGYGQLKNIIVGSGGSMSPNVHGRRLGGIDYTYFRTLGSISYAPSTGWAVMYRETESLS